MAVALAALLGAMAAADPTDLCTTGAHKATCTPHVTQGPYPTYGHWQHFPKLFRDNVTEGLPGVPMRLELSVLNTSCQPVTGVLVEIWHVNSTGYYSGYPHQRPAPNLPDATEANLNTTFLRGAVMADAGGLVTFHTNLPSPYAQRAAHVHYAVHVPTVNSSSEAAEWDSSYVTHIGQVFFQDAVMDAANKLWPYNIISENDLTHLEEDGIFRHEGDANTVCQFTPLDSSDLQAGAVASAQVIVDVTKKDPYKKGGFGPGPHGHHGHGPGPHGPDDPHHKGKGPQGGPEGPDGKEPPHLLNLWRTGTAAAAQLLHSAVQAVGGLFGRSAEHR